MNRFFLEPGQIQGDCARMTGTDVKHMGKVLRLSPGDTVILCDGAGMDYLARLETLDKEEARLSILDRTPSHTEPRCKVTLYQGLPKAGKMELLLQKCVELGLYALCPVQAARSVVRLSPEEFEKKRPRYQRVAYEAAKQARRGIIPEVYPLATFATADFSRHDLLLLAYEEEHGVSLKSILRSQETAQDIGLIIGPEGGFAEEEAALLIKKGAKSLSLGPRILRTETAGMAALAMILYELEEI